MGRGGMGGSKGIRESGWKWEREKKILRRESEGE